MTRATTSHMVCSTCGEKAYIESGGNAKLQPLHGALGIVKRYRVCSKGHKFPTTELCSAELADLRRRAYLYEREVGSATPAKEVQP